MKRVKILHCSDIHFDSPFKELNKTVSLKRQEELLEDFKKVIDLVLVEKVEILLIAGDFFDNMSLSKATIHFLMNEFSRIMDTYVFISPGNHDPYSKKSFYKILNWPKNVYVFTGPMESVVIDKLSVTIWGCAFNDRYSKETLLKKVEVDDKYINIMIIHGQVCKRGGSSEYNPIYLENIEESKMNYVALGHEHAFSGILRIGEVAYSYSGCLSGRGFDETGAKGVIIGYIYEKGVDLKFIPLSKREYVIREIYLQNSNTYDDIKNQIVASINEEDRKKNIYKIILKGYVKEYFILNEEILYEKLKDDFYYIKIENDTNVEIDLNKTANDYSLKGKYILKMLEILNECKNEEEKDIVNLALKLGVQCFSDQEVKLDEY